MDSCRVVIQPSAEREFRAVPFPFRRQLNARIHKLKADPVPADAERVEGELYRLRIHGWRLLYEVDAGARLVTLLAIARG